MAALLVPMTGAVAQTQSDPPALGDPYDGNLSPHGGFSASTDFCLQCHAVHDAPGDYALMALESVEAVCATCHTLGFITGSPTGELPGWSPSAPSGTASDRAVYTSNLGNGHAPGSSISPDKAQIYHYDGRTTNSELAGSLSCGNCHTPHGDFGQLINNWNPASDEGLGIPAGYRGALLYLDWEGTEGAWHWCADSAEVVPGDGVGATCGYAVLEDSDGDGFDSYAYGYKLLTRNPNYQYANAALTWDGRDGSDEWCASCHEPRLDSDTHNNHPRCTRCHGNPADGTSFDYPHTSTKAYLLVDIPDALCVSCHRQGRLP